MNVETIELIAALSHPSAYPVSVDRVEVMQTHISILFLAGQRVYKVKKAVKLGFVDYSTLELRKKFCEEEVRLNRRLAPHTYLGVQPVVRTAEGQIRIGAGDGEVIDYAVEMHRLPKQRMLNRMLERGEIDNQLLDTLVSLLGRFHSRSATGPGIDDYAEPQELRLQVDENLSALARFTGPGAGAILSNTLLQFLQRELTRFIDENDSLLRRRITEHRIREGHGDLHSGNICVTDSGIVVYDCIEFNQRFRCRDVAAELAFLAMDLEAQAYHAFSGYLVRRYVEMTADKEMETLMRLYKPHFAVVRGKVAALRSIDAGLDEAKREAARREASRYLHLAAGYLMGPVLIMMCGLPGTGKSRAARRIAETVHAVVVRSDAVRKELAGIEPTDHLGGQARDMYSSDFSRRTYGVLHNRARAALDQNRVIVVDAMMPRAETRSPFLELARSNGAPAVVAYTRASASLVRARMRDRSRDQREISDADWHVYERVRPVFEPPREVAASARVMIGPRSEDDDWIGRLLDCIIAFRTCGTNA